MKDSFRAPNAECVTRRFRIDAVLGVTTGKLMSSLHDIYDITNWMTSSNLMTYQLHRAFHPCKIRLLELFPALSEIVIPEGLAGDDACHAFLAKTIESHAEWYDVPPLPQGVYKSMHPLEEPIVKDKEIIVVHNDLPDHCG